MISVKTKQRANTKTTRKNINNRYTFTLSATDDLINLMDYFENRLSGLNRGEIVKLALIELRQSLLNKDYSTSNPIFLTQEQEESIEKAMLSPKTEPMTPEQMASWLNN